MEPYIVVEEWLKLYIKERNKLLDRIFEGELTLLKVKEIIKQATDHLVHHLRNIFTKSKNTAKSQSNNSKRRRNINNSHSKKINHDSERMNKDHFADLVNSYHSSELLKKNGIVMNENIEKWIKTPSTPNQNGQTRSSSCGTSYR